MNLKLEFRCVAILIARYTTWLYNSESNTNLQHAFAGKSLLFHVLFYVLSEYFCSLQHSRISALFAFAIEAEAYTIFKKLSDKYLFYGIFFGSS